MNRVLKCGIFMAMMITIATIGCQKDDSDGRGEGTLIINEKSYVITESCMCIKTDGTVKFIGFSDNSHSVRANVFFTNNIELISKTYSSNEIVIGFPMDGEGDFDDDNVEMVISKTGKIYNIVVTGKTKENEYTYTLTYNGKIRSEKLCNQ